MHMRLSKHMANDDSSLEQVVCIRQWHTCDRTDFHAICAAYVDGTAGNCCFCLREGSGSREVCYVSSKNEADLAAGQAGLTRKRRLHVLRLRPSASSLARDAAHRRCNLRARPAALPRLTSVQPPLQTSQQSHSVVITGQRLGF